MQEIVSFVPYLISMLISTIFYNLYYTKINNAKFKINILNSITILIATLLIFVNNCYTNFWLKFTFNALIFIILFKIIYKDKLTKIFLTYFYIYIGIILVEIIFTNLFNRIGFLNAYSEVISYSILKIVLSIIVESFLYLFFSIKIINKNIKKSIAFFENSFKTINILFILCTTGFIIGIINIENFATINSLKLIFFLMFVYLFLFIILVHSILNEETLKKSNIKLNEYNENYSKFVDEYRIYKHNINHKLSAMKVYGNKKINALIDELINEENNFDIKNNNLYNVPTGIKGIVLEKLYNKNFNIVINNKIKNDPFSNLSAKAFHNISECIGIALDNAIEASKETDEPIITLYLYEDLENIYIKVGNNFKNTIDLEKIGNKYYSTKNRGSGLGLFSIIRNNFVKEKISINNDIYFIELQIKKAR